MLLGLAARVVTGLVAGVLALPRIADALEKLAELRGAVERLEQLATFLANEMPEALHQLEAVQHELEAVRAQLEAVRRQLAWPGGAGEPDRERRSRAVPG
ncbi:hypothetical protein ACIGNX_34000 [Actinosynnema sp. NPDC053489]|uniref:hypothetical protein n=1 Tax=Actinosynnema sp. NPDC053489 TaxID=3363916 RepID=UPI0037C8BE64